MLNEFFKNNNDILNTLKKDGINGGEVAKIIENLGKCGDQIVNVHCCADNCKDISKFL